MNIHFKYALVGLLLQACGGIVSAQQMIQNPLIRPPTLESSSGGGDSAGSSGSGSRSAGRSGPPPSATMTGDSEDLRAKAANHLTQEDLNVRQQELNASVVPVPLLNIFNNMYVAAHAKGAIVLRRIDLSVSVRAAESPVPVVQQTSQNGQNGQQQAPVVSQTIPQQPATIRTAQSGPSVLRFREGKITNISGYKLVAHLNGLDVTVDWVSDKGVSTNVFFGAVESAGGFARVPDQSALQKVQKDSYKYLVPVLSNKSLTNNNGSNTQNNTNQNQNSSNSFGTSSPTFP